MEIFELVEGYCFEPTVIQESLSELEDFGSEFVKLGVLDKKVGCTENEDGRDQIGAGSSDCILVSGKTHLEYLWVLD